MIEELKRAFKINKRSHARIYKYIDKHYYSYIDKFPNIGTQLRCAWLIGYTYRDLLIKHDGISMRTGNNYTPVYEFDIIGGTCKCPFGNWFNIMMVQYSEFVEIIRKAEVVIDQIKADAIHREIENEKKTQRKRCKLLMDTYK